MEEKRSFELSAAAVAITAAAAVTASAAIAVGVVLHKLSKLNVIFERENRESPVDFEEDPFELEIDGLDDEEIPF